MRPSISESKITFKSYVKYTFITRLSDFGAFAENILRFPAGKEFRLFK